MGPVTPWHRLTRLLKLDRRELAHIYLYAIVGGAIGLSVPLGVQAIINLISGGQVATSWGVLIAFVTIGVAFTGALQVMQLALAENIQQRLFARSAFEFAYRIPRIRMEAVGGKYVPELVNRFFDTMTIQKGLSKLLLDIPLALLQIMLCTVLLALYHPFFLAFGALLLLLLYFTFRSSARRGMETSLRESGYKYAVAHWLEELGRSLGTFKLIGETSLPLDRTDELVNGYVKARKAHFRVLMGQYVSMVAFKVIVTLSLLALGGALVMNERMNLGQFVAAEIVILLLMGAVEKIIMRIETIYDVLTALEKVGSVTDLPLDRADGLRTLDRDATRGMEVRVTGLEFRSHFHGRPVLQGIDLHLKPGEKVCLAGPNGAGKTTLLRMLGGAMAPHAGTVQLDGHPMNSLDLALVRSVIGDSLNDEDVFAGTIQENIVVGRSWVKEQEVMDACRVTGLVDQLGQFPEGLLTRIDPQGTRLPKSVVKRILLARCIAGSPRLILLEDSLGNWDRQDREQVLGWISAPERPWTLLVVSNDPWLHQRCARTVHLHEGRIMTA